MEFVNDNNYYLVTTTKNYSNSDDINNLYQIILANIITRMLIITCRDAKLHINKDNNLKLLNKPNLSLIEIIDKHYNSSFLKNYSFVHGFILDEKGNKMTKFLDIINDYPIDFIIFYLFMKIDYENDIIFSKSNMEYICNSLLINGFYKLFNTFTNIVKDIKNYPFKQISEQCFEKMPLNELLDISDFSIQLQRKIEFCNKIFSNDEPWKETHEDKNIFMNDIGVVFYSIMVMMSVVIPEKIKEMNSHLGFDIPGIIY